MLQKPTLIGYDSKSFSTGQMEYDKSNDFYTALGLKPDAESKAVKLNYYKLA